MFKNLFTKQEDKNVWDILDYYMPAEEYMVECEKQSIYGKDYVFPPMVKLDSHQNRNLRYKSNLQWEQNYLECLKIYYEFTGKGNNSINRCEEYIKMMIKYLEKFQ
jgi:hypothetical protein